METRYHTPQLDLSEPEVEEVAATVGALQVIFISSGSAALHLVMEAKRLG
jgi:hypothetical protein